MLNVEVQCFAHMVIAPTVSEFCVIGNTQHWQSNFVPKLAVGVKMATFPTSRGQAQLTYESNSYILCLTFRFTINNYI